MKLSGGYLLPISLERQSVFDENDTDYYIEPVPEFGFSRNRLLICFVISAEGNLTHITQATRGAWAGTELRKLTLRGIVELDTPIEIKTILDNANNKFIKKITQLCSSGGLIPPKTFQEVLRIIMTLQPESARILSRYSVDRVRRIQGLSDRKTEILGEQQEAVLTALSLAKIDRKELHGWNLQDDGNVDSFLAGLDQIRLREDPMVINDLTNLPGYDTIKSMAHASVYYENDDTRLTVLLANRLPLEEQLGVDLIYYNETFSCFIMVQYKAMEMEGHESIYRFPNKQLDIEIDRMRHVQAELLKLQKSNEADDFRIDENPFFLKLCPRISFDPDDISLVKGMYLPLDYWDKIKNHPGVKGPKGGLGISYKNVRRYLDNTTFIAFASGGWIGTNFAQSAELQLAIRSTLESGRALVFAVSSIKDK